MATPYTGTLKTSYGVGGRAGPSYRFAANDVAAAFVTFTDVPGTPAVVHFPDGLVLADLIVSAVAGTTTALQFVRGAARNEHVIALGPLLQTLAGMNGATRLGPLYGAPIVPGADYGLVQV